MQNIQEEVMSALQLILERRRVSIDLLKAHFGSSAKAATILSILETKGFISKPERAEKWEIDFDMIENFLETPNQENFVELEISNSGTLSQQETYLDQNDNFSQTIKNGDLQNIIDKMYLANSKFNIVNILSSDLTVSEIDNSLETITQAKIKYKEIVSNYKSFAEKNNILEKKLLDLENTKEELKNKLTLQSKDVSNNNSSSYLWGICVLSSIIALINIDSKIGKFALFVCISSIIIITLSKLLIHKENINIDNSKEEREKIESTIKALNINRKDIKQEQEALRKSYNLEKNITPLRVNASYIKLFELENVLKKMKVILMDPKETSSNKIIALENLLYLINKKYIDEQMLDEQKKATNYAEQQAEYAAENLREMKKQSRELEAQNDMLTLQTYNKVSEMQGIDPTLVSAQTYAHMSKIKKERDNNK